MLSFENFKKLIDGIQKSDNENYAFGDAIDKFNSSWSVFSFASELKNNVISVINDLMELPEDCDVISWYLYEDVEHFIEEPQGRYKTEWYLDSVEMLYIYLSSYKKNRVDNLDLLCSIAKALATEAHANQIDKGGHPYIEHICSVADGVKSTEQKIIAYLHDIVEDAGYTLIKLLDIGFPPYIINSINLLTHKKGEDYFDYVKRIKFDDNARAVKMSDLKNNMNIERIPNPTTKDFKRVEKYKKAFSILEA